MGGQIVWFFSAPTVFVCPHCEVVAAHYTDERCPTCGGPWVEFVSTEGAINDAHEERENTERTSPVLTPGEPPCGACGQPSTCLHHLDGDPDTLGSLDICDSCLASKWWPMFSESIDGGDDGWLVIRGSVKVSGSAGHGAFYPTQADAQTKADGLNGVS